MNLADCTTLEQVESMRSARVTTRMEICSKHGEWADRCYACELAEVQRENEILRAACAAQADTIRIAALHLAESERLRLAAEAEAARMRPVLEAAMKWRTDQRMAPFCDDDDALMDALCNYLAAQAAKEA